MRPEVASREASGQQTLITGPCPPFSRSFLPFFFFYHATRPHTRPRRARGGSRPLRSERACSRDEVSSLSRWYFQFHRAWVNEARGLQKLGRPNPRNVLCPRRNGDPMVPLLHPFIPPRARAHPFKRGALSRTGFRHITFADYRPAPRSMSPSHPRDTYLPDYRDPFLRYASVSGR